MPHLRYGKGKRDAVEGGIISALRKAGASVEQLAERNAPDLLIGYKGRNILMEVKSQRGRLSKGQAQWHTNWLGQVAVVRSAEEALGILYEGNGDNASCYP